MKVNLLTSNLQIKLGFVNHALSTKTQLPILQNILIQTQGNKIKISSTDLEIGIEVFVKAEIDEKGEVTIPAKTFIELINSLSEENIYLQTDKDSLSVVTKKTKSTFQTIKSEEFPKLYKEKGEKIAVFKEKDMKKDFSAIIFASSQDTTRPALSGVFVKQESNGFLLVATDGYRLSLKHHLVNAEKSENQIIVPARVFRELMSIKEDTDEINVYLSSENGQIIFEQGETILVGRLIEGTFPNYEKIIPSDFSVSVVFDREELQKAVKICSIFARDSANIVKLTLSKNQITVSSKSTSVGENSVTVDASLKGEENEIAFNAHYLMDLLTSIDEKDMVFEMTGPLNPGVFKLKDDASYLHLIMPVRLQG